eukprot:9679178-Lingulodinium_polyedra.AAC.1
MPRFVAQVKATPSAAAAVVLGWSAAWPLRGSGSTVSSAKAASEEAGGEGACSRQSACGGAG